MKEYQVGHTIIKTIENIEKIEYIISIKDKDIANLTIKKKYLNGYDSIDSIEILKTYQYRGYIRTLIEYHIMNNGPLLIDLLKEEKDKEIWFSIAETPGWLLYRCVIDSNNVEVRLPIYWSNIDRDFLNRNPALYLKIYKRVVSEKTLEYNKRKNRTFNVGDWLKIRKKYNP
jgi:hypothetical protein